MLSRPLSALLLCSLLACSSADDTSTAAAPVYPGPGTAAGTAGTATAAGGFSGGGAGGTAATPGGAAGGLATGGTSGAGGSPVGQAGSTAAAGAAGAAGGANEPADPGATLYTTYCSACHGPDADGQMLLGPEIRHPQHDQAMYLIRNGREDTTFAGPMLAIDMATLSDADIELILGYLDAFPQPTDGAGLYHDYCENCHGADARGGPTTRDLSLVANITDFTSNVRDGHHPGEFDNRTEYMPAQGPEQLSDAELQLIVDYVNTLL